MTHKGETVARGRVVRRTPLAQAQMILDDLLRHVEMVNHDPDAVRYVERVSVFGSLMRGEEAVGDIDLAVETSRRPGVHSNRGSKFGAATHAIRSALRWVCSWRSFGSCNYGAEHCARLVSKA
jgi:hypothetical protein